MTCERLLTSFAACAFRYAQLQRRYATPRAFHVWYPSLYLLQTSPAECLSTVWESHGAKEAPCAWAPVLHPVRSPPLSPAALSPPSHALTPGSTSASLGVCRSCTRWHLPTGKDALCCRVWAKRKKKKKITSLKQAVLQLSNLPSRVYTAYHTVPWEKQLYSSNPIPLPACHKYHTATESGTWLVSRILFTCAWALQQNKSTRNQQLHDSSAECNSPPSCYLKAGRKDSWKDAHLNILLCGYFWNDISCSPLVAKPCK